MEEGAAAGLCANARGFNLHAPVDVIENLVFDEEDEDLEVEIGDLVSYAPIDAPSQLIHVRITAQQTDPVQGLVAENTPLGTVLLGATVGETAVLRVPGKSAQSFIIQSTKRGAQETTH